jgi:hypothetical protein
MSQQSARRSALDAQAARRKERADRERRLEALAVAVLTALGERDGAVKDAEKRAGGGAAGDKRRGTVGARGRRVVQHRDHGPRGDSAAPPGAQPAGRPVSARPLSAAGLAALKRAVNDSATVERFRSKAVQVPGSQCLWWTGAVSGRGHGRFSAG